MVDCVMVLLIFLMISTAFVNDPGIEVQKPDVSGTQLGDQNVLLIAISADNRIYFDGQEIRAGPGGGAGEAGGDRPVSGPGHSRGPRLEPRGVRDRVRRGETRRHPACPVCHDAGGRTLTKPAMAGDLPILRMESDAGSRRNSAQRVLWALASPFACSGASRISPGVTRVSPRPRSRISGPSRCLQPPPPPPHGAARAGAGDP